MAEFQVTNRSDRAVDRLGVTFAPGEQVQVEAGRREVHALRACKALEVAPVDGTAGEAPAGDTAADSGPVEGDAEQDAGGPADEAPSLTHWTIDEVKAAVTDGTFTASAALASEQQGKGRARLVEWLEG